jgi:hypothetical protein
LGIRLDHQTFNVGRLQGMSGSPVPFPFCDAFSLVPARIPVVLVMWILLGLGESVFRAIRWPDVPVASEYDPKESLAHILEPIA